jgi:ATP-dependent DNA helicase DinG
MEFSVLRRGPAHPEMKQVFGEDGWLSQHLDSYRVRPGQLSLAESVAASLRAGNHFLAEAPTGVGKSLAYGVPAALTALLGARRAVIATANITLQEQLFKKDLPLIAELLGRFMPEERRLKFALVKGMSNYLCYHKMEELEKEPPNERWFEEISDWSLRTKTGDKSELDVEYESQIWGQVSMGSEECLRRDCPQWEKCYVGKAREEGADVIVTNYHMLYSDAMVRLGGGSGILPDYSVLVMDEVHEATGIAQSFCGFEMKESYLIRLATRIGRLDIPSAGARAVTTRKRAAAFFQNVRKIKPEKIIKKPLGKGADAGLLECMEKNIDLIDYFVAQLEDEIEKLKDRGQKVKAKTVKVKAARAKGLKRTIATKCAQIRHLVEGEKGEIPHGTVFYTERRNKEVLLCCKVVEVQSFLREAFFDQVTTTGVSATVVTDTDTPGEEFDFIIGELGIEVGANTLVVDSPFDPSNFLLVIPSDVASPKERDDHTDDVSMVVEDVVKGIGGRTMTLFTSYRALNEVHEYLKDCLKGFNILVQGEKPRMKIIQEFQRRDRSVILGTSSFWQGVDIPGEALSCVIIDKLPFATPTDPVLQYWDQESDKRGGGWYNSAFFKYSIPKATIALKQGSGRLIRQEDDFGAVILCDTRVRTTSYGERFNSAFPKGHWTTDNVEDAIHFIKMVLAGSPLHRGDWYQAPTAMVRKVRHHTRDVRFGLGLSHT